MGLNFIRVESLNTSQKFIEALKGILLDYLKGGKDALRRKGY
jgi:hypothetical protein